MATPPDYWLGDIPNGRPISARGLLSEIVGWHVGSQMDRHYSAAISQAEGRGWVGRRTHYYADGTPNEAYCLTEAGFTELARVKGDVERVRASHAFYERGAAKYGPKT